VMFAGIAASAQPSAGRDDPIARMLGRDQTRVPPAADLPLAPPKNLPLQAPGLSPGSNAQGSQPIVLSARIGEHADRTRFVIELSDPVNLRTFTLANPDRVVVDMPEVQWRVGAPPRPSGYGSVKSYRYGVFRKGNSRMVIDLNRPVTVSDALVLPPSAGFGYRVVIDLFPTQQVKFQANAGWPADLKQRESDAERLAVLMGVPAGGPSGNNSGKKIIVIDPGHGGIDTGTKSGNGHDEKDVVLAFGLLLRDKLEKTGKYRVIMTRSDDTFIPLWDRVRFARAHKASLFISVHADSIPKSEGQAEGATVYTLSDRASDAQAERLADAENKSDVIAGVDLTSQPDDVANILIDLAQRETKMFSSQFARTLVGELKGTARLHQHPLKSAGFIVLKAPDVPSVLVELGYMSTQDDLVNLVSRAWRSRTADSLVSAVTTFFAPRLAGAGPAPGPD
jgi:N-acetylmuramoyl-L-alanine amidase